MNLYKELIESAPVKARLQFGINENVVVEAIDLSVRKRSGMPIKANTFITLTKVDPETRKPIETLEGSFWNLDPTKPDFVEDNFTDQLTTLSSLIDAVGGDSGEFAGEVIAATELEDIDEVFALSKDKKGAVVLMDAMKAAFGKQMDGKLGKNGTLLKCKIVSNKKGFLEFPTEEGWILPMDSEDTLPPISTGEKKRYENAMDAPRETSGTPDTPGEAPSGEAEVATDTGAGVFDL